MVLNNYPVLRVAEVREVALVTALVKVVVREVVMEV